MKCQILFSGKNKNKVSHLLNLSKEWKSLIMKKANLRHDVQQEFYVLVCNV